MINPNPPPPSGYLALLLHAHLPLVRHPGGQALEERWYLQAACESYLPLLLGLNKLQQRNITYSLTISLSPTLIYMLRDPYLNQRLADYLEQLLTLAELECTRTRNQPTIHRLACFYMERFAALGYAFRTTYNSDLLGAFGRLGKSGQVELITTAATHGFLPLILTPEARRAQIRLAISLFQAVFGYTPRGFWLPECGYLPGLEAELADAGLDYFIVDTHGLLHATPTPKQAPYRPVFCGNSRVAAVARDPETAHQVWNRNEGYPGNPVYREYYRDIGYDLPWASLEQFLTEGVRVDTGIKYHAIGAGTTTPLYDPELAGQRAQEDANHFLQQRSVQLGRLSATGPDSLVLAPYDAELFGHWWYEGPDWLEAVLGNAAAAGVPLCTIGAYLQNFPPASKSTLHFSSWGEGGYGHVWLNAAVDWVYPQLHAAEIIMVELASRIIEPNPDQGRILRQMARELLLAQSSDWPFILHAGTATAYATRRLTQHLDQFNDLRMMLEHPCPPQLAAEDEEFMPLVDYRWYIRPQWHQWTTSTSPAVLILTWEYPPRVIGGIAPHVHGLAHALASLGIKVDVLTISQTAEEIHEQDGAVNLIRVPAPQDPGVSFTDWVQSFNLRMLDCLNRLVPRSISPWQVIHAHDWLVGSAATSYAATHRLPLIATIHATEAGRNGELFTAEQRLIHSREQQLVALADRVICCSQAMEQEVAQLSPETATNLTVIPNGINPATLEQRETPPHLPWSPDVPLVLFVGRLVPEKGVQVLLEAAPAIIAAVPGVNLVIAGHGPYLGELRRLSGQLGLTGQVHFLGFKPAAQLSYLYAIAQVAVFPSLYEPFGIVALEAMALGTPLVIAKVGGLAEIVTDGQDGLCFPPGDSQALANQVKRLLQDRDLAQRLAKNARHKVLNSYNWLNIARNTAQVYCQAEQDYRRLESNQQQVVGGGFNRFLNW